MYYIITVFTESIAAGMVNFYWIDGKRNPGDIVSKHWAYPQVWHMLQQFLFCSGETRNLLQDGDPYSKTSPKEYHNKDDVLVTHDSITAKVNDGVENGQKELMQHVMPSTPSTPMC
jgi:hypothetical protein